VVLRFVVVLLVRAWRSNMLKQFQLQEMFEYKDGALYNKHLGMFDTEKEAKAAYNLSAQLIYGEYKHEVRI
jgi:hypothetical protein